MVTQTRTADTTPNHHNSSREAVHISSMVNLPRNHISHIPSKPAMHSLLVKRAMVLNLSRLIPRHPNRVLMVRRILKYQVPCLVNQ